MTGGLAVGGLTVRFGAHHAVDDVSLALPAGHVLAVLGPSGCGKSTLLRAVAGLEPPAAGTVGFAGHDVTAVPTHRRGFALMFQDGQLFPHLRVGDNVGYALRLRRTPPAERARRVAELLELVGLPGYADREPSSLSGGEQQRVALARALAVRPRLLLLDEPLSALDRDLRERLAHDLRDILAAEATTALLVTHDPEEAFSVADRMAVMREGRLVQSGTVEEVWRRPADAATARFLGYAGVLPADRAAPLARLLGPAFDRRPIALRRSALVVDDAGPLVGAVTTARLATTGTRLRVEVEGLGTLDAVAAPDRTVRVGERVRLAIDPARVAVLPGW